MKLEHLSRIQKLYFGHEELATALEISPASARVAASRYAKRGLLVRLRRNLYMLREVWENAGIEKKFQIANLGQVPSYISLMTALDYHGVTTQIQRNFFESIAIMRTREIRVDKTIFKYTRISAGLYFGFKKEKEFFMALPEKAFLDAIYLMSYGRYSLDLSAIDADRLDRKKLAALSETFPMRTQNLLRTYEYLPAA
jgi:predicted transcriptional regulator of viral defense system